jgi:TatD DNase family protein
MTDAPFWIDSHAHLTMFDDHELPAVLDRAAEHGVGGVLVPATNAEDLERSLELASRYPDRVVSAAGIHPHDARTLDDGLKKRVEDALKAPGVVAVGEIGLDYHYMNSPREDQIAALRWQLDLAMERSLPVVLHNRESWTDLESELERCDGRLTGVCHSFAEGPAQARKVVALGLRIGISGMVTFKAADNIREMAAAVTAEHVMVETDSPFLAPVPHRGSRNEPAYVVRVGERLAREWERPMEEIAAVTTNVFCELFGLSKDWAVGTGR